MQDFLYYDKITGGCITSAAPGQVCGLNSVAAECDSLTATACDCLPGYVSEDGLTCLGIICSCYNVSMQG